MPDYTFYVEDYLGEDIPEKEFPRFIRRAGDELRRMREMYAVAPRQGLDPELAESMALCAVADAMYEFAQEDEARGIAKVSVGSVSETYTAPPELCSRTVPSDFLLSILVHDGKEIFPDHDRQYFSGTDTDGCHCT